MKKLTTIAFALLLGATLSMAQATGGSTDTSTTKTSKTTAHKGAKKGHKGGKKKQKNSGGSTTPLPK